MSEFNKSYRIRTDVGQDTQLHVKLDREYDVLEIMSLKIDQENAYKFHTSNYGVIAGRVLANDAFGIPNAKISVFINIDDTDANDIVKSVLYPYNTTSSKDKNNVRYNLLPNEQLTNCHTIIGTFPEKQYMLDNDSVLEVFEKYYKYTTRTNNAGDYMIFGVPTGSQTIHVDIDLSDIGILSQKPRDMVYKGYHINQFENPNKFKYDTNLETLTQVISQDSIADVIPFWGDNEEGDIGITRCDINVQYKFEPTCVFMGSAISDTPSNGISKKCIPMPGMGAMDEVTTGSGTIEMIRKTPSGDVEEFQIKGTQLIDGDGVWCYQIPMNLDYMMTDEYGNMVPTNNPEKGIPTRTKVRFRMSMQDFENDNTNIFRCKMLIPHNPNIYSDNCDEELDYNFGTNTKEESYRDLFWNGVYTVKSYIPRIQKGSNWKDEKFTGIKRVNYHGDKNPIPYNNIRINIPFAYSMLCSLIKTSIRLSSFLNWIFKFTAKSFISQEDEDGITSSGSYLSLSGELCNNNLEHLCIIPGIDVVKTAKRASGNRTTLLGITILKHYKEISGDDNIDDKIKEYLEFIKDDNDKQSIDYKNSNLVAQDNTSCNLIPVDVDEGDKKEHAKIDVEIKGIRVTDKIDYFIQCIEMKLAQEFKVIQFDFYNDWINGLVYIPRWERNIKKKRTYTWNGVKYNTKIEACNENFKASNRNIVQQCGLEYNINTNNVINNFGCSKSEKKAMCHKDASVRKYYGVFSQNGVVHTTETSKSQYVYYFKPYENNNNKNIRLFATDIVLLGTLNDCDKWGIPNNLNELVSTSYQMPPNLALTDSDLEGNDYEARVDMSKTIRMTITPKKAQCSNLYGVGYDDDTSCYTGINPMEEDGNYTEMAGVNWDYTGPLQNYGEETIKYNPGGHFLGLTCRNSATTIKSCVNLSRICEYGVWMSQRQVLNIPSSTNGQFNNYAIVPSGLISKDEISDTNYRRLFASMNKNKLRTVIDSQTGYPIYDFEYVNPTNFGGELNNQIKKDEAYNRKVKDLDTEHYYTYTDSDYYRRSSIVKTRNIPTETQIMRTGEFYDKEYYKFRFGLKDEDFNSSIERKKRYLLHNDNVVSFPMYDNSFYFYFGLHDGKTALDKFKESYYAVCEQNHDLTQVDKFLNITNLHVMNNGVCDNLLTHTGAIQFSINAHYDFYLDAGIKVELYNSKGDLVRNKNITSINDSIVYFTFLESDVYVVKVLYDKDKVERLDVEVKNIEITGELTGVNFNKDVSNIYESINFHSQRPNYGGYIVINDNMLNYVRGSIATIDDDNKPTNWDDNNHIDIDVFPNGIWSYVKEVRVVNFENRITIKNSFNNPLTFTYNNLNVVVKQDGDGNYMIPVPKADVKYEVYVTLFIANLTCMPDKVDKEIEDTYDFKIGEVYISNGSKFDLLYNNISYKSILKKFENSNPVDFSSYEGWWSNDSIITETLATQWNLKNALFQTSLEIPHKVDITYIGGVAPYTEHIKGDDEKEGDWSKETDLTKSDLLAINIPTINFDRNGIKRRNFGYNIKDNYGQKIPSYLDNTEEKYFIFPVIYKPFFMEIAACYFDNVGKYFLCGNVYNGKTWDYTKGFNDVKLNGLKITNFADISKNDMTMELDEPTLTENKGGFGFKTDNKELYKYNGRKVVISREIEPITYGLTNNGIINNFKLEIGSTYEGKLNTNLILDDKIEENYNDSTYANRGNLEFFKFKINGKSVKDKYYIKMDVVRPDYNTSCTIYPIIDSNNNGYPYPWKDDKPLFSGNEYDKLFRHLMTNNIIKDNPYIVNDGSDMDGYIEINKIENTNEKMYYVAVPNNGNVMDSTSNPNNKIYGISISNIINLGSLSKFYPLDIKVSGVDKLMSDGSFKTTLTIKPNTDIEAKEKNVNNFKNKKYELIFYKDKSRQINILTLTALSSNVEKIEIDITQYRSFLGLDGDTTELYFDYNVYSGEEKCPTPYVGKSVIFEGK